MVVADGDRVERAESALSAAIVVSAVCRPNAECCPPSLWLGLQTASVMWMRGVWCVRRRVGAGSGSDLGSGSLSQHGAEESGGRAPSNSRDRIVVSTSRCGRDNPGSNPGHGTSLLSSVSFW